MEERLITHVTNILSTLTILSCVFLKVPQIISVRDTQSADGIYIQAMMMEVTGFSIMSLYNFTNEYNVMTYMEYPIILLQVYVLLYYVLKYKRQLHLPVVPMMIVAYVIVVGSFAMGYLPRTILSYMIPFCTPLSGFAKVSYIYGIITTSNADTIATSTWAMSVTTNLARIFTVYLDSADIKLMANLFISSILSLAVLFTALYYQHCVRPRPRRVRRKPCRRHSHNHTQQVG